MIRTKTLSLNSTAQAVLALDEVPNPSTISVQNTHETAYIYLGNENVNSSSYGFRLKPGATFVVDLGAYDTLYAVGDSGSTASVFILEQ